ncbi:MAG: high-potential iron-sulfur protein [Ferruginibacter sp.]
MSEANSRRLFLQKCFSSALKLAFVPIMIERCTSKTTEKGGETKAANSADPCNDYSELVKEDIKKRESLGYVKKSAAENKQCGNCNLWLPPAAGKACGKCQLFKGPVPATAGCTYWAPILTKKI